MQPPDRAHLLVRALPQYVSWTYPATSEPSTSLPTKVAPPPLLPPTREIPSNTPPPAFTPKAPYPPWAEVAKPPSETDAGRGFEDLIVVLSELSANGGSAPRFSTVFSLWRDRKPDAFGTVSAAGFKAYLRLAESAGIVTLEQHQDGDGWVTLNHQWNTNSDSPPQLTPPPHSGSRFHDLIQILNDLRLAGDPEPQFFIVGPRLLRRNPSIYDDTGLRRFEEYVKAAVKAGVVTVREVKNGDGLLKLCPAYCSPPVPSQTPAMTANTPPTRPDGNASPFAPLVEFLKFKQLTSGQPISYSEVIAHLVSTHPDLDSLCTSVPGVTTVSQYIDAALASGLVSLAGGTTTSRDALVSLRVGLPDSPSPPMRPTISTAPPSSLLPSQEFVVPSSSVNVTPDSFRDLTTVLMELRVSTGESVFRFSTVTPLLLKRKPNAYASVGVARFMDYVTLAMENGVVTAGEMDKGDGWVSLSVGNPKPGGPATSPPSSKTVGGGTTTATPPSVSLEGGGVDPKFVDLVEIMGEIWRKGEKKPHLSRVGAELLQDAGRRARTLSACGAPKFKAYAELARDAGIVEIYGQPGKETMSLDPTIRVKAGYT